MKHLLVAAPALALLAVAAPLTANAPAAPASPGLAAPNADMGRDLFRQRCSSCHATEPGAVSRMGPNLAGVVGRGAAAGEYGYSEALKTSGLSWTREMLDSYLAAPQKLVPGGRMVVSLGNAGERGAVIDYLASISPTPVPSTVVPEIKPTDAPDTHDHHAGH